MRQHRFTIRRSVAVVAAAGLVAGVLAISTAVTPAPAAQAASPTTSAYLPISPIRVADSRDGFGISSKLRTDDTRTLKVVTPAVTAAAGVNAGSNVTAVAVQVTATQTNGSGHFTVFAADKQRPLASSLNWMRPGHTITNLASVPVSRDGKIKIFAKSGTHVVVDVQGVFIESPQSRSGRLQLFDAPFRYLDTREIRRPLTSGSTTTIDMSDLVSSTASAVVVNLTSVNNAQQGFLTAFPYGSPLPNASNLNTPDPALNTAVGSQGYIGLNNGKFNIYSLGNTDLVIDVIGYFTGPGDALSSEGLFVPVAPFRMVDTREANNVPSCMTARRLDAGGAMPVGVTGRGGLPSSGVSAVAANIAVTQTASAGWARLWPAGATEPETSSINSGFVNHTVANHAVTKLGAGGFAVRASSAMHVIVDVSGYFAGSTPTGGLKMNCERAPLSPPAQAAEFQRLANEVVALTNVERRAAGLSPVQQLAPLDQAALIHSQDQRNVRCARGYLSHTGSDGSTGFDRINRTSLRGQFSRWGENIGCGQRTPAQIVQGWMNSPGHRANILNPKFTKIGVGVSQSDSGLMYWTQKFATLW